MKCKKGEVSAFKAKTRLSQILAGFREVRKQVRGGLKVRELIERGRRY